MKSEEALEHISYIKELLMKSRLKASEGYPLFMLGGAFWFFGSILSVLSNYYSWVNYSWPVFSFAGIIAARAIVIRHKWPVLDAKLLKQLGTQCLIILLSSIPMGILLFNLNAGWAFKAYMPFQVGVAYMAVGVFIGRDLKYIGLGMIVTSLLSLVIPFPLQDIWLGVAGGGGLLLTGLIFRKQVKNRG